MSCDNIDQFSRFHIHYGRALAATALLVKGPLNRKKIIFQVYVIRPNYEFAISSSIVPTISKF